MKHPLVLAGIGAVVVIAIGSIVFLSQKPSDQDSKLPNDDVSIDLADVGDRYVVYAPEILDQAANTRRILFFYANWCPTCRPTDANLRESDGRIPSDVTVIRVNYNDDDTDQNEKDLAKKYNVTYQHTFVQIDAAGNEVTRWNGGQIDELLTNLR